MNDYPYRKSLRLKGYDYCKSGAYFVTLCTKQMIMQFGEIRNGIMGLNEGGLIARQCWLGIPKHFPHVLLDEFVIMPDHVHGIIWINEYHNFKKAHFPAQDENSASNNTSSVRYENFRTVQRKAQPWYGAKSGSLSSVIRGFKIGVTKWFNKNSSDYFGWHKSFNDRIIRNEKELNAIREYIRKNPRNWKG